MRPVIAIPMGDPAGIGPEILLKTAADEETAGMARCLAVGSRRVLEHALQYPNMPEVTLRCVTAPEEGDWRAGVLNLIDLDNVDMNRFAPGQVSGMCGRAAYEYIERAIRSEERR